MLVRETGKIGVCCATTGPGATNLLSVPVDILRSPKSGLIAFPNLHRLVTKPASVVDFVALEKLCQELYTVLSQNRQVVLLIGHDCAGATQEIIIFAELIGAPIVTTQRGKSWINPYHHRARGVFGFAEHKSARKVLTDESVDLILVVGTDLGEWSTGGWDPVLLNDKLVHIHNAMTFFARSPMARLHVYGTISTIFKELVSRFETIQREGKLSLIGKVREQEIIATVYPGRSTTFSITVPKTII